MYRPSAGIEASQVRYPQLAITGDRTRKTGVMSSSYKQTLIYGDTAEIVIIISMDHFMFWVSCVELEFELLRCHSGLTQPIFRDTAQIVIIISMNYNCYNYNNFIHETPQWYQK